MQDEVIHAPAPCDNESKPTNDAAYDPKDTDTKNA